VGLNKGARPHRAAMPKRGLPAKSLLLMPHRVALALQQDGWVLRAESIWHKLNLTPATCADLYRAQIDAGAAVATHRQLLSGARTFLRWCVRQRLLSADPAADVRPVGKPRAGKQQLRIDEARRLIGVCLGHAREGDRAAAAILVIAFTGRRLREVTTRPVRDLDDGGRVLWMPPSSTTKRRPASVAIPEPVRSVLLRLAEGLAPEAPLFHGGEAPSTHSSWLGRRLHQFCDEAGVIYHTKRTRGRPRRPRSEPIADRLASDRFPRSLP